MAAAIVTPTTSRPDLNNDCLREIFLYIEVKERIKLRTVCKAWREAVDDCWREVRSVTIINTRTMRRSSIKNKITGTNKRVLITQPGPRCRLTEWVMKRCGNVITEFHQENTKFGLRLAAKRCFNIDKLVTNVRTNRDDENVSQVFAINKKLRIINLTIEISDAELCFSTIPTDNLEILTIKVCGNFPQEMTLIGLKQVIRGSSSLKELNLEGFDDELMGLIGQKITLKILTLTGYSTLNGLTEMGLTSVLNLKNLRKLEIHVTLCDPPVTDDFLMAIIDNIPLLEVIIISNSNRVTDKGFKSLASLEKLRELTMIDSEMITDEFLVLFSGLNVLDVHHCNVWDEGVIKLLEKTTTMRYLDVVGSHVTNATLVAAIKTTKKRNNGIVLKLGIKCTPANPAALVETSPLLEILY